MKKYLLELSLLIGIISALVFGTFANAEQQELSRKLIRLHVIANSDSAEDQETKLLVRDKILSEVGRLTAECKDVSESRAVISKNLNTIEKIANDELSRLGVSDRAQASLSEVYFPTRDYETFSLPAGKYEALRIIIGKGEGKNWWCVLFPPLCISESTTEVISSAEEAGLDEKEISLMTSKKPEIRLKFKSVELVGRLINALS